MVSVAILNQKGGVGKTATAISLAAGLALEGHQVLLIDLDPQAHSTLSLGFKPHTPAVEQCLFDEVPAAEVILTTHVHQLDLLPASENLSHADLVLGHRAGREQCLQQAVLPIASRYNFTLIDCPPSLNLLLVNALVAADWFLVPVAPHYLSLSGVQQLLDTTERIHQGIGQCARLLGLVLTQVAPRQRAARELSDLLRERFGAKVFQTVIPRDVALEECPSHGETIFEYAPRSKGALAYQVLTKEVLIRLD